MVLMNFEQSLAESLRKNQFPGITSSCEETRSRAERDMHEFEQSTSAAEMSIIIRRHHSKECWILEGGSICTCPSMPPLDMNIRDLLLGDMNRLRYVWRFNMSLVSHKENVAEHSYYVALYSFWIACWVMHNVQGVTIDLAKLLTSALFHDCEESRTGDFSRPFKHSNPDLRAAIESAAHHEVTKVFSGILPNTKTAEVLSDIWKNSKSDTHEGLILDLADFLSVFSHMWQEVNVSNATMLTHYETMVAYSEKFSDRKFNFVRPIVLETQNLVKRVLTNPELMRRLQMH
jgi:5'-deoxynucleotidase